MPALSGARRRGKRGRARVAVADAAVSLYAGRATGAAGANDAAGANALPRADVAAAATDDEPNNNKPKDSKPKNEKPNHKQFKHENPKQ